MYEAHASSAPLPNAMGLDLRPQTDQAAVLHEDAIATVSGEIYQLLLQARPCFHHSYTLDANSSLPCAADRDEGDVRYRPPLGKQVAVQPFPTW